MHNEQGAVCRRLREGALSSAAALLPCSATTLAPTSASVWRRLAMSLGPAWSACCPVVEHASSSLCAVARVRVAVTAQSRIAGPCMYHRNLHTPTADVHSIITVGMPLALMRSR